MMGSHGAMMGPQRNGPMDPETRELGLSQEQAERRGQLYSRANSSKVIELKPREGERSGVNSGESTTESLPLGKHWGQTLPLSPQTKR